MRAAVIDAFGGPLHVAELPDPAPAPGEVLIRVAAAPVNPVDLSTRGGFFFGEAPSFPMVLGWDAAGTVVAVGEGVDGPAPGDDVVAVSVQAVTGVGTYAELVALPVANVAPAPRGVAATDAATLPVCGLTAAQALDLLAVRPGETVLVAGAAGAVGGFAVQLARHRGCRVVASLAGRTFDQARALGADAIVDRDGDVPGQVREALGGRGVDAALNTAGPAAVDGLLASLREGGRYATTVPGTDAGREGAALQVRPDPTLLAELSGLMARGIVTARVDRILPLDQAAEAHATVERGDARAKLVLRP